MTPRPSSPAPARCIRSTRPRWPKGLISLALFASALACGGQSDALRSTDTGNPPVIVSQKLRVTASATGVTVSGDAGAMPGGASVEVVNTTTGASETTTAGADGSFAVDISGSVTDEYRVYATVRGQTSQSSVTASGAAPPDAGLAGLEFLLEAAEGYTPVEGSTISLAFDTSNVSVSAGCNQQSGAYSLCDGRLCVSQLSTTDIGCDSALHAQDAWLAAFLSASPLVTHIGPRLTLAGADATLAFLDSELATPDRPLLGTTWVIDTLIEGGAASNAPIEPPPTVVFQEDGSLLVFTGCHTGSGTHAANQVVQAIPLSSILYTEEGCNSPGSAAISDHVAAVLSEGTIYYELDAARLTLTRNTLGLGAVARD